MRPLPLVCILLAAPTHGLTTASWCVRTAAAAVPAAAAPRSAVGARAAAPRMQQSMPSPSFTEKAHVRRGTLVWPHVHAAWLLISAVVEFCLRLGRPPAASTAIAAAQPPLQHAHADRVIEPIFVHGALCERVVDEDGNEHCICHTDIAHDDYACRCAAKDGKYVWYCTQPW